MADLIFHRAATSGSHADLVFGADGGSTPDLVTAVLTGTFPGMTLVATIGLVATAVLTGTFPPMAFAAEADYHSNTSRPTVGQVTTAWQEAEAQTKATGVRLQQAAAVSSPTRVVVRDAAPVTSVTGLRLQDAGRASRAAVVGRLQEAMQLPTLALGASLQDASREARAAVLARLQEAMQLANLPMASSFQDGLRTSRANVQARLQEAQPLHAYAADRFKSARQLPIAGVKGRLQDAMRPPPGRSVAPPPPAPVPCYTPPRFNAVHLVLQDAPATPHLVFYCQRHPVIPPVDAVVVVPVRRVYMTFNELSLHRVDGNVELAAVGLSMQLDADSFTWSFSATLDRTSLATLADLQAGEPVELQASVNGANYRLIAQSMTRDRSFPTTRINIQGLGLAALLDAPYAPTLNFANATDRTAQQLMADVLQINGVGFGWDVDWQLTDWLVPGGAWAHQGSYISALSEIAAAAGGYLQPHPTATVLRVLPRYALAPWHWNDLVDGLVPDFELPSAMATRESVKWVRKPSYNRVLVRGQNIGVQDIVTRAGTAGDLEAPMVVDPLLTHGLATRQRATAILSDTGPQAQIDLRLPVLAETGIIVPGASVRYVDGAESFLGIVRSTSIEWSRPTLRQVIGVQTHG